MKYYLFLVAVAVCEGARIPRISESYVPGFQGVYHGHGGPGYPHGLTGVPFSGDYRAQYGNLDVANGYFGRQATAGDQANFVGHFPGVRGDFNLQALPRNYGRLNHAHDYDYQL